MDTLWNSILTVALLLLTGVTKLLYDAIDRLQATDRELMKKVQDVEVTIAGDYVHKDDLDKRLDRMTDLLRDIDEKLDHKVNRIDCPLIHEAMVGGRRKTDP